MTDTTSDSIQSVLSRILEVLTLPDIVHKTKIGYKKLLAVQKGEPALLSDEENTVIRNLGKTLGTLRRETSTAVSQEVRPDVPENPRVSEAKKWILEMTEKLTQTRIAEVSGVSSLTISSIRSGKSKRISRRVYLSLMKLKRKFDAGEVDTSVKKTTRRIKEQKDLQQSVKDSRSGEEPRWEPVFREIDGLISNTERKLAFFRELQALREKYGYDT